MKLMTTGWPLIEENKYKNWYFSIIEKALRQDRLKSPNVYYEEHHILPKSLGGNNKQNNRVLLSAKEHFICHLLLPKFLVNRTDRYKMLCAVWYISHTHKDPTLTINSNTYHRIKSEFSQISREKMLERYSNPEYVKSHAIKVQKSWKDGRRDEQLEHMRENSPFKDPKIHRKTIESREKNGNNVFVTNNPMRNEESIKKKVESTKRNPNRTKNISAGIRRMLEDEEFAKEYKSKLSEASKKNWNDPEYRTKVLNARKKFYEDKKNRLL